jgi:DNA-binding MarR family transcriptional regulator
MRMAAGCSDGGRLLGWRQAARVAAGCSGGGRLLGWRQAARVVRGDPGGPVHAEDPAGFTLHSKSGEGSPQSEGLRLSSRGPKMPFDVARLKVHMHTMPAALDMSAIENCVCFNLRMVTRIVTKFFDAELRRHGIRPTQGTILLALSSKPAWSMAELSDCLGLERTSLVRNLQPLQRDGWVEAVGGGRGGRVELSITDMGREKIAECLPAWRSAQSAAVDALGKERWSELLTDLKTVALALNQ